MTEEEWDAVVRVHMKGTFAPSHHAAAYWRERSKAGEPTDARLINTTSVSGLYANVGQTNYGSAKAGIAAFTQIAAQELGRYGVTVNAIAPGTLTRLTGDLEVPEEILRNFAPEAVAPVVAWLASTDSADVTGQVIKSDPGSCSRSPRAGTGVLRRNRCHPAAEVGPKVRALLGEARPRTLFHEVS